VKREVDLLVVGGGPAGAAVAALAAEAGARTLLVERARFPRDKVCGEFVSSEGCRVLARLAVLDRLLAAGGVWMDSCRLTHPRGASIEVALPRLRANGREALGISRRLLDAELLSLAASRGAEVLQPWRATHPIRDGRRVQGFQLREVGGERTAEVRAKLVVAADGRRSVLARLLHPELCDPRRSGPRSWFGLETHFETGPGGRRNRIELHLFDGGYAGLGPIEAGRSNLALLVTVAALRAAGGSPDLLLERRLRSNSFLDEALADAPRCAPWRSVGPLRFGTRRPTAAGALFVGDAAGTVDPFCGEGVANALCAAELAQPFVLEAIARGGLETDAARRYDAAWSAAFAPMTRRVRQLGRVLERPWLARPLLHLLAGVGRGVAPQLVAATRTNWSG
jgi:flavin-dependent dehydrogenase